MFERFTTSARGIVVRAQQEAVRAGDAWIGTEHVVVALADDDGVAGEVLRAAGVTADAARTARAAGSGRAEDLDADALKSIGIDLDQVRRSVEDTFGTGALDGATPARRTRRWFSRVSGHVPFTPHTKKALKRSIRQAVANGDTHIGSEHLLLGVLDAEGPGGAVLADLGADLGALRSSTLERLRRSA